MKTNFALAKPFNLQMFASGDNNNLGVRTYMPQFKELLTAVFGVQAYFDDFFAGGGWKHSTESRALRKPFR